MSNIFTSFEAWNWVKSESWAARFVWLEVRVGVDTIKGVERVAWDYVKGRALMLIREGIDDITPVGLSAVPLGAWGAPGTTATFCSSLGASAPGDRQRTTG